MKAALDWCFRDRRTGRYVIGQAPNVPLLLFLAATAIGWLVDRDSTLGRVAWGVATAGLSWWAVAEIWSGVNPWRRLLGVGGVALVVTRILAG